MVSVFPITLVRDYTFFILSFTGKLVRPPGFEPGSSAWQAEILPGWTTAANIPHIQSSGILICYPASLKHAIHRSTAVKDDEAMVIASLKKREEMKNLEF